MGSTIPRQVVLGCEQKLVRHQHLRKPASNMFDGFAILSGCDQSSLVSGNAVWNSSQACLL